MTEVVRSADPVVSQAKRAACRGRVDEAFALLEQGIADAPDPWRRAELLYHLGALQRRVGDFAAASRNFATVVAAASGTDPLLRARVQLQQAEVAIRRGDATECGALLQSAFRELRSAGATPADLGFYHLVKGHLQAHDNDVAQAQASYERARSLFRNAGDPTEESYALMVMGNCYSQALDFGKALAYYNRALKTLDQGEGDSLLLSRIYANMAETHQDLGELDKARAEYLDAMVLMRRAQDLRGLAQAHTALGQLELARGGLEEAEKNLLESRGICERTGDVLIDAFNGPSLALLRLRQGNSTAAQQEVDKDLRRIERLTNAGAKALTWSVAAEVSASRGQDESADRFFAKGVETYLGIGDRLKAAEVTFQWAKWLYKSKREEEAMTRLQEVITPLIELGLRAQERRILSEWERLVHGR